MKSKFVKADIVKLFLDNGAEYDKARIFTSAIIGAMKQALAEGRTIELRGMGTLEQKERKAYMAHNPKTGETLLTPARRRILFRPGQELKAALRNVPEV